MDTLSTVLYPEKTFIKNEGKKSRSFQQKELRIFFKQEGNNKRKNFGHIKKEERK